MNNPESQEEAEFYAQQGADEEAEYQASMSAQAEMEAEEHNIEIARNMIQQEKEIDEITNSLYEAYGSGTGVLFGIPSELKSSVRAIVKVILNMKAHKKT